MKKLLIVEDNPSFRLFLNESLNSHYEITEAVNTAEARQSIQEKHFDLYLLDLNLPDGKGTDLLDIIKVKDPEAKAVILTAYGDIPIAIEAIRKGAVDFLQKPIDYNDLISRLLRITGTDNKESVNNILGDSPLTEMLRRQIKNIAGSDVTVLIYGQSGTGKELAADIIHRMSGRNTGKMIVADFSRIKPEFIESELFGYVKGAYSGADKSQKGKLSEADHGTIFLDNIDEADTRVQGKLLRFIETGTFYPLGSSKQEKVDVRIIVSAKTDLKKMVDDGIFRRDLYFRINVYPLELHPLNERVMDIEPIAAGKLNELNRKYNKKMPMPDINMLSMMKEYRWPGNIRELLNYIERSFTEGKYDSISMEKENEGIGLKEKLRHIKANAEKKEIINALKSCSGNKTRAAKMLKISYRSLLEKIREYELDKY